MSIYGARQHKPKPIYGGGISVGGALQDNGCVCEPTIPEEVTLGNFYTTLSLLKHTLANLYPIRVVTAPGIGTMSIRGSAPFVIISRLLWVEMYGASSQYQITFNVSNPYHLAQLKDIYLEHRKDWHTDPLFRAIGY
jgi:hypothetical protein